MTHGDDPDDYDLIVYRLKAALRGAGACPTGHCLGLPECDGLRCAAPKPTSLTPDDG